MEKGAAWGKFKSYKDAGLVEAGEKLDIEPAASVSEPQNARSLRFAAQMRAPQTQSGERAGSFHAPEIEIVR